LLSRKLTIEEVRISGLDLHLPIVDTASGESSPPADNIELAVLVRNSEIQLSRFTGYIGGVPVQASGRFRGQPSKTPVSSEVLIKRVTAAYLDAAGKLQTLRPRLQTIDAPRVTLRFSPTGVAAELTADAVDLNAFPQGPDGTLSGIKLQIRFPLTNQAHVPVKITGEVAAATLPNDITARNLVFRLNGLIVTSAGFEAPSLDLEIASVGFRDIEAGPLVASISKVENSGSPHQLRADVSVVFAESPWRLQAEGDPRLGTARLSLDGFLGDATLAFAGARIDRDLTALLDPAIPAPLHVAATFGPGWTLARAFGRLHSGSVRVGGAQLDETGTEFSYDGTRVLCDNLVLRQGESLAHGSYEMNTQTMDFRFLLTGGLRPEGIESWFHAWWRNFWTDFDFSRALPAADVDVRGRWGDLTATRVFVQAEGSGTGLKGMAFDRVRTRLFLRPHWFDILHFDVLQSAQTAHGRFARLLDLEKDTWRHMEFDVHSTLPLGTISSLFKEESAELLAPYHFGAPPNLRLSGRVDSAASSAGKHEHIDVVLASTGPMTYHRFPLADLKFEANLRDDRIDLPTLAVGFAEGQANGTARLWKEADTRRLAFNVTLADANLGAVTQAVALLQPPALTEKKPDQASRERQQRLDRGRLVFALAAEGLYDDFYSFKGTGRAAITGAELAQLNLFGPLSEALSGTYFSFGSFSLTTVDAPFILEGERVRFDDLRVTGPSALLQAKGDYRLRDGRLDFTTKVHPFDESTSMVGNAVGFVLTPLSKVFEVKLQGTLLKPSWIFAYGPSRLINSITGHEEKAPRPPAPAPPEAAGPAP
jgi:hypothetical protein